jgi:hypothetical protein
VCRGVVLGDLCCVRLLPAAGELWVVETEVYRGVVLGDLCCVRLLPAAGELSGKRRRVSFFRFPELPISLCLRSIPRLHSSSVFRLVIRLLSDFPLPLRSCFFSFFLSIDSRGSYRSLSSVAIPNPASKDQQSPLRTPVKRVG